MTPLWLRVYDAAANGHGLAGRELLGGHFDATAVNGHDQINFKRPRSQSGVMPPHSIAQLAGRDQVW